MNKPMTSFFVHGQPKPGGSKSAFYNKALGRSMIVDAGGKPTKLWRQAVAHYGLQAWPDGPLDALMRVQYVFYLQRPKGHYGSGKNAGVLKANAPAHPGVMPDALKLARSTEDALSGIIYTDDARCVDLMIYKRYVSEQHPHTGCYVRVYLVAQTVGEMKDE